MGFHEGTCGDDVDSQSAFVEILRWELGLAGVRTREFISALVSPLAANFDRTPGHCCKSVNLVQLSTPEQRFLRMFGFPFGETCVHAAIDSTQL